MPTLYLLIMGVALFGAGIGILFYRAAAQRGTAEPLAEWLADFSVASYEPMKRVLDESEFEFIARQPGYRPYIGKMLRRERKAVFKMYLRRALRDFNRMVSIAKLMIVYGEESKAGFARALWLEQMKFYFTIYALRSRLVLYPVMPGTWDVGGLVNTLTRLSQEVQQLAVPNPAAA